MRAFAPLDDLYALLGQLESCLGFGIPAEDYIVGREQLYYIFLHETLHAFIGKAARWIYDLSDDETDFIDEVACRIILDDLDKRLSLTRTRRPTTTTT